MYRTEYGTTCIGRGPDGGHSKQVQLLGLDSLSLMIKYCKDALVWGYIFVLVVLC